MILVTVEVFDEWFVSWFELGPRELSQILLCDLGDERFGELVRLFAVHVCTLHAGAVYTAVWADAWAEEVFCELQNQGWGEIGRRGRVKFAQIELIDVIQEPILAYKIRLNKEHKK